MAGTGASYGLDKGFLVNPAYSGGSVNKYRFVALSSSGIDVASTLAIGVVQEDVDSTKVTTGKAVADVRLLGVSKVAVADNTVVLGSRVKLGAGGAVVAASAATDKVVGICVGRPSGTMASGDLAEILLTPGGLSN